TLGQSTGTSWSSFGVAYAPKGTAISQGVPAAAFYTGNVSSTNNVGPGLNNTRTIRLTIPVNTTKGGGVLGAIWACYGNSGLLYVGSAGCITNGGGGGVPTYVEVATVNIA
ncbi:MAG: hypothetical protein KGH62_02625, partial [Candidatus Micrarchaeota archaeon]|nr:hypothetical protein [Candidatus Micrarchaeota archaeon]